MEINAWLDWPLSYFCSLLILVGSYLLGWALQRLVGFASATSGILPPTLTHVATRSLLGLAVVATLTAVLYTQGETSLWGLVIAGVVLLFVIRKYPDDFKLPQTDSPLSLRQTVLYLLGVSLPLAFLMLYQNTGGGLAYFRPLNYDYLYYGIMSEAMCELGKENTMLYYNIMNPDWFPPQPHHQYLLWLSALFGKILPYPSAWHNVLTLPLALAIAYVFVVIDLFKHLGAKPAMACFLATGLALCTGYWAELLQHLPLGDQLDYYPFLFASFKFPKFFILGALLALLVTAFYHRKWAWAFWLFLPMPFIYWIGLGYYPVCVLLFGLAWLGGYPVRQHLWWLVMGLALGTAYYLFFYMIAPASPPEFVPQSKVSMEMLQELSPKLLVNTLGRTSLEFFYFSLPFTLITGAILLSSPSSGAFIKLRPRLGHFLLFFATLFYTLLVMSWLFSPLISFNAIQYYFHFVPFTGVLGIALVLFVLHKAKLDLRPAWVYQSLLVLFVAIGIVKGIYRVSTEDYPFNRNNFNKLNLSFLEELNARKPRSELGGLFTNYTDIRQAVPVVTYVWFTYHPLAMLEDYDGTISLFKPNLEKLAKVMGGHEMVTQGVTGYSIYKGLLESQNPELDLTPQEIQNQYLDRYGLTWVMTTRNVSLPPLIQARVAETLTDSISGFSIHYLDEKPKRK